MTLSATADPSCAADSMCDCQSVGLRRRSEACPGWPWPTESCCPRAARSAVPAACQVVGRHQQGWFLQLRRERGMQESATLPLPAAVEAWRQAAHEPRVPSAHLARAFLGLTAPDRKTQRRGRRTHVQVQRQETLESRRQGWQACGLSELSQLREQPGRRWPSRDRPARLQR